MTDASDPAADSRIDTSVPHSARIWNYWLGGKDNYAVDRAAGDSWTVIHPEIVVIARETRKFLHRSVRFVAREAGVRQFLDVGTGLPTVDNTHEVAQRMAPDARVVYVDNDPLVLAHARALLTSSAEGSTRYVHADMHDTAALVEEASKDLDLTRPVGVYFMGVLGHIADTAEARGIVQALMDRMPSGSYLTICDSTHPDDDEAFALAQQEYADSGAVPYWNRTRAEIRGFFDGLEFIDPGFVSVPLWRPEIDAPEPLDHFGGVARKP
jgi:hypothetical protein